jgi:hypothetical protein
MRPRSRWIAALTLVPVFLAACSETPPTGVEPTTTVPLLQISDGANSPGRDGFYFLPPIVPSAGSFVGTFDANLSPEVRVCQLAGSVCGTVIKIFTTATAEPVDVIPNKQTYSVNWSTKNNPSSLTTSVKYRIEVRVGAQLLGFADLAFVKSNKEAGSVPAGTVAAVLGSPLTIKFRIETRTVGSVTVTPPTASIGLPGNQAFSADVRDLHGAVVPNAPVIWASSNTAVATVSEASGTSATATAVALGNTVVSATVGGMTGSANVTVLQKPNAQDDSYSGTVGQLLSPGATPTVPTLLANDDKGSPAGTITSVRVAGIDYPLPLPQGGIPFAGGLLQLWSDGNFSVSTVTAGQFTFRYTLTNAGGSDDATVTVSMGSGVPAAMVAVSDQDQTGAAGSAVAEPPSVRVTDEYGNPVAGISVTFTPATLGSGTLGTVAGSPAVTNANGVATVGSWTLLTTIFFGSRERLHSLTASAAALTTQFVARAVAGPPVSVTVSPRRFLVPGEEPPPDILEFDEQLTFRAVVNDVYGNAVYGHFVNFSSSDDAAVAISPWRVEMISPPLGSGGGLVPGPGTLVDVRALRIATDQSVEIRGSVDGLPDLRDAYTITVKKSTPPVAKSDAFVIPPCSSVGCTLMTVVSGNVLSDNGYGADDLADPPAVITGFGGVLFGPGATCIGGSLSGLSGWCAAGGEMSFLTATGGRITVGIALDGTLTYSCQGDASSCAFAFQYQLKNIYGTSTATVSIAPGSTGASVTTSMQKVAGSKQATTP